MTQTAKRFTNGPSKPPDWDSFLAAISHPDIPATFLDGPERADAPQARDPFEGWEN